MKPDSLGEAFAAGFVLGSFSALFIVYIVCKMYGVL